MHASKQAGGCAQQLGHAWGDIVEQPQEASGPTHPAHNSPRTWPPKPQALQHPWITGSEWKHYLPDLSPDPRTRDAAGGGGGGNAGGDGKAVAQRQQAERQQAEDFAALVFPEMQGSDGGRRAGAVAGVSGSGRVVNWGRSAGRCFVEGGPVCVRVVSACFCGHACRSPSRLSPVAHCQTVCPSQPKRAALPPCGPPAPPCPTHTCPAPCQACKQH